MKSMTQIRVAMSSRDGICDGSVSRTNRASCQQCTSSRQPRRLLPLPSRVLRRGSVDASAKCNTGRRALRPRVCLRGAPASASQGQGTRHACQAAVQPPKSRVGRRKGGPTPEHPRLNRASQVPLTPSAENTVGADDMSCEPLTKPLGALGRDAGPEGFEVELVPNPILLNPLSTLHQL